ncbi:MAG: hypothetical protein F6K41_06770 [Symploca sp. SIO3E6]|nr:hypothetical protein [Caldora sp. SIO3E6]
MSCSFRANPILSLQAGGAEGDKGDKGDGEVGSGGAEERRSGGAEEEERTDNFWIQRSINPTQNFVHPGGETKEKFSIPHSPFPIPKQQITNDYW